MRMSAADRSPSDVPLDRAAVAARCGYINPNTITVYVGRGTFPRPDGHMGRAPYWYASTVDEWKAARRGVGQPKKQRPVKKPKKTTTVKAAQA